MLTYRPGGLGSLLLSGLSVQGHKIRLGLERTPPTLSKALALTARPFVPLCFLFLCRKHNTEGTTVKIPPWKIFPRRPSESLLI